MKPVAAAVAHRGVGRELQAVAGGGRFDERRELDGQRELVLAGATELVPVPNTVVPSGKNSPASSR